MVDAPQPQSHDQDHGQSQVPCQLCGVGVGTQRHHESTHAFDQHGVGAFSECCERSANIRKVDHHPFLHRCDVRGNGSLEAPGVDGVGGDGNIAGREQMIHILVVPHAITQLASCGDGLHADSAAPSRLERAQQARGDHGLAHAGVGPGDEVVTHVFDL
jgi:hypothetical protein